MPPREVLLAKLAGGFQAPLVKAAGLFQAFTRNLAYGLKALHRHDAARRGGPQAPPRQAARPRPRPRPRHRPKRAEAEPENPETEAATGTPKPSRRADRDRSNNGRSELMATMSKEDLLEVFKNMTVLELNEFLKAFEEEFGVTAAAPVQSRRPVVAAARPRPRQPRSRTSSTSSSSPPATRRSRSSRSCASSPAWA